VEFRFRDRLATGGTVRTAAAFVLFAALILVLARPALAAGEGFYGPLPGLLVGATTANLTVNAAGYRHLVRRAALDTVDDYIAADYPRSALRVARRLVEEDPGDPACHLALGDARRALGPRGDLAGEQNLTEKQKKRNLAARVVLTRDERQSKLLDTPEGQRNLKTNMEAARKSYLKVLEIDPGMAETHRGLGYVSRALGRPIDAGRELVTYLKARPAAGPKTDQGDPVQDFEVLLQQQKKKE